MCDVWCVCQVFLQPVCSALPLLNLTSRFLLFNCDGSEPCRVLKTAIQVWKWNSETHPVKGWNGALVCFVWVVECASCCQCNQGNIFHTLLWWKTVVCYFISEDDALYLMKMCCKMLEMQTSRKALPFIFPLSAFNPCLCVCIVCVPYVIQQCNEVFMALMLCISKQNAITWPALGIVATIPRFTDCLQTTDEAPPLSITTSCS